jgi:opacity protein-like surface antigen
LAAADSGRAADMPVKALVAPVPVQTWTGCYFGAQVGAVQSNATWNYNGLNPYNAALDPASPFFGTLVVPEENFSQWKMLVGGQVGCNWQVNGPWVVGVEAAWNAKAMNISRDNNYPQLTGFPSIVETEISSIASLTGRLGYAIAPDWLIYAKGGVAFAKIETSAHVSPSGVFDGIIWNDSKWHTGWTVGGGVEYRLFRNVTVGGEYNYYRFGSKDHHGAIPLSGLPPANFVNFSADADVHTFMAKLNFYNGMSPAAQVGADQSRFGGTFSSFVNSSASYSSWTGDRGSNVFAPEKGKGHQLYSPTTIGIDYVQSGALKVETRMKGGYVYANQGTPGQGATYEGPVDTQASFNATFLNFDSVRPQLGVAVNLPTGTSYLPNNQRFARMDPDLVDIGSYGAGFNVNPTAGFVIGLNQNTAMSFSAGYAWQGAFIREGVDLGAGVDPDGGGFGTGAFDLKRKINPGDVFTGNVNYTTQLGNLVVLASFAYMSESTAEIDGVDSGKAGARYISNLTLNYQFDDRWAISLNGSWSYSEKNEISLAGFIVPEPKNSNSNVIIGSIEPSYMLTERLKLAANYSFLWRDENFYDQFENQFIPAKTKHTVGLSATYALSQTASIQLRGSYSWIHQDTSAFLPVTLVPLTVASIPPALSYESWMTSISANVNF